MTAALASYVDTVDLPAEPGVSTRAVRAVPRMMAEIARTPGSSATDCGDRSTPRRHYRQQPPPAAVHDEAPPQPAADVQAAVTVLGRLPARHGVPRGDLTGAN